MSITNKYNNTAIIHFDSSNHKYYLKEIAKGNEIPSVTKIIDIIDKSAPLLYWFGGLVRDYLAKNNFGSGNSLSEAQILEVSKLHETAKNAAGGIGTDLHKLIERCIRAKEVFDEDLMFRAWKKWYDSFNKEIVYIEQVLYSKKYNYVGTCDAVIKKDDGKYYICDWKTSNYLKKEYVLQLGAYASAITEEYGIPIEGGILVRLDKKELGKIEVVEFSKQELKNGMKAFVNCLDLQNNLKLIKI